MLFTNVKAPAVGALLVLVLLITFNNRFEYPIAFITPFTSKVYIGLLVPIPTFPCIINPFVGAPILLYALPILTLLAIASLDNGLLHPIPTLDCNKNTVFPTLDH